MGADFFESFEEIRSNVARSVPHLGIGENSLIRRAIIDKNTRIGKNVRLLNRREVETEDGADGSYYIREGIIIVPKNAVIKDNTEI